MTKDFHPEGQWLALGGRGRHRFRWQTSSRMAGHVVVTHMWEDNIMQGLAMHDVPLDNLPSAWAQLIRKK